MSAFPQTKPASVDQVNNFTTGCSDFSIKQQDIVKIFNQQSGTIMQGICKFEDGFKTLYPLFKGLSEAGKPKSLNISFSATEKTAFFHYPVADDQEVTSFFSKLILYLQHELKFKKVLKELIANSNHFKTEQVLLQNAMMGSGEN